MDYLGIFTRLLYMAGDIVLYRWVLGYQFTRTKWRLVLAVLCGGLFLVLPGTSFDLPLLKLPGIEYYIWTTLYLYDILTIATCVSLFCRLKIGLAFFVLVARAMLDGLVYSIFQAVFYYEIAEHNVWPTYGVVSNLVFLFLVGCLARWLHVRDTEITYVKEMKSWHFWLYGCILCAPVILSIFSTTIVNKERLELLDIFYEQIVKVAVIGFVVLAVILRGKNKKLEEQTALNERCIREQTTQYHFLYEKQKELRAFRHDINGHFIVLGRLIDQGNLPALKEYMAKLQNIHKDAFFICSDNIIGDAIFNAYYGRGKKDGVDIEVVGKFDEKLTMAETDLCIVLTNVVSNAYEAAMKCNGEKSVRIEIGQNKNLTFLTVINTAPEKPEIIDGLMQTTKEDKELHGMGITNIIHTLKSYDGTIHWAYEDGKVCTKIIV